MSIEGISIILDKSILHGLSQSEIEALCRHYFLVVPPILLTEILGDLCAKPRKNKDPEKQVRMLAQKILTFSACKQVDYRRLRDESLLGNNMSTSFRPVVEPSDVLDDEDGPIAYITDSIEMKQIKDWQVGKFTEDDREDAQLWKLTSVANLSDYKQTLLSIPQLANLSSLRSIFETMDVTYKNDSEQWQRIDWFCQRIRMRSEVKQQVMQRWEERRQPFYVFAPYAYYCFLIEQVFFRGLVNGIIPASSKDKAYVDLQYAYYFPYSRIFSSTDKLHQRMWEAFANQRQQMFVSGGILKDDLRALSEHWNNCSEEIRDELRRISPHPPELADSFTNEAYRTLIAWGVRRPPEQIVLRSDRTPEETKALVDRILDKYERVRNKVEQPNS